MLKVLDHIKIYESGRIVIMLMDGIEIACVGKHK